MGGILRQRLQGFHNDLLDLLIGDLSWGAGTGLIMKPLESVLDESPPPLPHRWQCDSKFLSDLRIGLARIGFLTSTGQHDATAQRECLCGLGTPRPSYKRFPLGIRQNQFCFRSCHDTLIPRSFGPHARDDTDNKPAAQGLNNVFLTHNTSV